MEVKKNHKTKTIRGVFNKTLLTIVMLITITACKEELEQHVPVTAPTGQTNQYQNKIVSKYDIPKVISAIGYTGLLQAKNSQKQEIIELENIMEVVDSYGNTSYSFRINHRNKEQPLNFFNLQVNQYDLETPYVFEYIVDPNAYQVYLEGNANDYSHIKAIKVYHLNDFLNKINTPSVSKIAAKTGSTTDCGDGVIISGGGTEGTNTGSGPSDVSGSLGDTFNSTSECSYSTEQHCCKYGGCTPHPSSVCGPNGTGPGSTLVITIDCSGSGSSIGSTGVLARTTTSECEEPDPTGGYGVNGPDGIFEMINTLTTRLNLDSEQKQFLMQNILFADQAEKYLNANNYSEEAKTKATQALDIAEGLASIWPQTSEEWAVVVSLFKSVALEIGLGFVPGYDFVEAIKSWKEGNKWTAAFSLALGVGSLAGTSAFKGAFKAGGKLYKVIKVFETIKHYANKLGAVIKKGFGTKLSGEIVQLTDKAGNIIAQGKEVADVVLDFTRKVADDVINKLTNTLSSTVKNNLDEALEQGDIIAEIVEDSVEEIVEATTKKGSKLSWDEVKALFKRGNDFNKKGRDKYQFNEIHLGNGKRLDSYIPGLEIISRKATDLQNIKPSTFENYLRELTTKYAKNTTIKSSKLPEGTKLVGEYFLEIPASNQAFYEASTIFKNLANQYGVTIKFLVE